MQPWKEFSTKQSFWQAVRLRPPAFGRDQRRSRTHSVRRAIAHTRHRHAYRRFMFRAHRSRLDARGHTGLFRHTARRRASFPLRSPSYRLPSLTACAASIARTFCVSGALVFSRTSGCLMRATMPPLSTASLLCSATAACVLSVRTSTTLARQRIAWSTRDALASQALSLRKRNRNLRDSLDRMSAIAAKNDENGATGDEAAEQKSTGETAARECARGLRRASRAGAYRASQAPA